MSQGRFQSLQDPETLRLFIENLKEGVYITNESGEILDANPACLEILGISSIEELRSHRAQDLFADPTQRAQEMELLAREGEVRELELTLRRADGEERTVLDSCHVMRDAETGQMLYHGILIDISGRKQLESRFHEASLRDPLTGCYNRRFLGEIEKRPSAFETWGTIVVDVDNFKEFNDDFGHQAGDEVLIKVSRFLQLNARSEDAVIRMGGDEFLLLLLGASARYVAEVGQRLRLTAAEQDVPFFSLGWATRLGKESRERTNDTAARALLQIRLFERRSRQKRLRGPRRRLVEGVLAD